MFNRVIGRTLLGAGVVSAVGGVYANHMMKSEPQHPISRMLTFWTGAVPVLFHYRWVKFWGAVRNTPQAEIDATYESMDESYADQVLQTILVLRGFYVKIGQVLATREDFLPQPWIERMKTLEDAVPARSFREVRATLERELGQSIDDVFSEFDPVALGAASIGQVHRARLRATGEQVAVKVQFEDAESLFRGDIRNMKAFVAIAQPEQEIVFEEIERQFMTEFDYRCEAENLNIVRANLSQYADKVVVPRPYPEITTPMSGKSLEQLEAEFKNKKPSSDNQEQVQEPAISASQVAWLLRLDNARRSVKYWSAWLYNALLGYPLSFLCFGAKWPLVKLPERADADEMAAPLNYQAITETLIKVHVHAMLVNGVFNGDPHPGNILYLRDGRLGLIDYGQTKRLTQEQRVMIARILLALAQRDGERVVKYARATGTKWKYDDAYVIEKMATAFLDRDDRTVTEGKNLQFFFEAMHKRDPIVVMSNYFVMAGRMAMLLRAMSYAFKMPLSFAALSRSVATQVLLAEGDDEDKVWASKPSNFYNPSGYMKGDPITL